MSQTDHEDKRRVAIAANPYSGMRPNRPFVDALARALERKALDARIIWEPAERRALLADPATPQYYRCVVAAGGDGTVCAVINERPPVPLAVLPLGSENLFAREMGFINDPDALAQAIASARTRRIDLGRVGEQRFSLMVGVGFDAEVVHRVGLWRAAGAKLKRVNRLSYVKPILRSLFRYPFGQLEINADGVRILGTHALIFNLPQYALRLALPPGVQGDDGLLDWIVLRDPGAFKLLGYCRSLRRREAPAREDIICGQARAIAVSSDTRAPVQIDGDPAGFTPKEIAVLPRALEVITPCAP